jgi:hypothetical protein
VVLNGAIPRVAPFPFVQAATRRRAAIAGVDLIAPNPNTFEHAGRVARDERRVARGKPPAERAT